ncbi:hypothetical protein, partial [Burkholderia sp. LMG 13014]|uniref:hypothetical protein n=1 Tax=Burkholderia sp. LMG 13014 TaxID=2709306 RepID=UPI0035A9906D
RRSRNAIARIAPTRDSRCRPSRHRLFLLCEHRVNRVQSRGPTAPPAAAAKRIPPAPTTGNRAGSAARPCNRTKKAGGT